MNISANHCRLIGIFMRATQNYRIIFSPSFTPSLCNPGTLSKQNKAKLLIAWNEISIDPCGDQSLYLRAALLELPVTGGFH